MCVCSSIKGLAWLCRHVFDDVCVVGLLVVLSTTPTFPVNDLETFDRQLVLTELPYHRTPCQTKPIPSYYLDIYTFIFQTISLYSRYLTCVITEFMLHI